MTEKINREIIRVIKENKYFVAGMLILVSVVLVNIFPAGYVISSTDTSQIINVRENFKEFFISSPAFFLFLCFFYVLDFLDISYTAQLSFLLGSFIFGSYLSFYFFTRLYFSISDFLRSALSLFYAINLFTLYIFTMHALGYSPFFFLYIFIPLLAGFYIKFLIEKRIVFLAGFGLVLFATSPGFDNPAFALGLAIAFLAITTGLILTGKIVLDGKFFLSLAALSLISFLVSSFWILPIIPVAKSGVESLYTTNATNLNLALRETASPILNTLSLIHFSYNYFPFNFPYKKLLFLKDFFIAISFLPIILISFFLFFFKNGTHKKMFLAFFAAFLALIMLAAKVSYPFETVNNFIFTAWGLNTLRGYDKLAIFIPFLFSILLLITLDNIEKSKGKKVIFFIIFFILIAPLPFYLGKLQQNMSMRFADLSPEKKDFRKASLVFLVKIPDEYYSIKSPINNDKGVFFVASLPNNMGDSGTGSSNYPKWKLNGVDITKSLYNREFIEPNTPFFSDWYFSKEFNEQRSETNPDWLVKLLGTLNVKYIIYHKDAPRGAVEQSQWKIESLESKGLIKKMSSSDYFDLYEIDSAYFFPRLSWQKGDVELRKDPVSVERNFSRIKDSISTASFKEINSRKYEVEIDGILKDNLVLTHPYDVNWKAYAIGKNGKEVEMGEHFIARGYANGWKMKEGMDAEKILIEYYSERLTWKGMAISLSTLTLLVGYLGFFSMKNFPRTGLSKNKYLG